MNSELNGEVVWGCGELRLLRETCLSLYDTGLVHGDCVTEMLRTFGHKPFRVEDHLQRFRHSIDAALLECPYSDEQLVSAMDEVVVHNTAALEPYADLGIIIFVTGGLNRTYSGKLSEMQESTEKRNKTTCVHTFPLHFELWRDSLRNGQHLVVAPLQAIPPECMDPTIKTRSRMHWRIGDRLVKRSHPGATAVFADEDDYLTETSSANLFVFKDGEVLTPLADRVLNGISRQVVMELAAAAGYTVKEQLIPIELALEADEIWTSSTPYCMLPVTRFHGTTVSNGEPGPVFQQILDAWSQMVGMDIRAQILAEE